MRVNGNTPLPDKNFSFEPRMKGSRSDLADQIFKLQQDEATVVDARRAPTAELVKVGETTVLFPAEEDTKPQRQLLDFLKTGEGGDRTVTNGERMCIENNREPFDITS